MRLSDSDRFTSRSVDKLESIMPWTILKFFNIDFRLLRKVLRSFSGWLGFRGSSRRGGCQESELFCLWLVPKGHCLLPTHIFRQISGAWVVDKPKIVCCCFWLFLLQETASQEVAIFIWNQGREPRLSDLEN